MLRLNGLLGGVRPNVPNFRPGTPRAFLGVMCLWIGCSFLAGCSSAAEDAASSPNSPDAGGGQSGDGDGDLGIDPETIVFERSSTLTLLPTEVAELRVLVEPAERQTVTFDILADAETFDGFLLEASTKVQDDGIASISIQAPSMPATFAVRAKLGNQEAQLAVSVSAQGYGTLNVHPNYLGKRSIERWTASARAGTSCEQLGSYWQDGSLTASGMSSVKLDSVPSGVSIAVSLRGDELVSGCTTLTNVKADGVLDVTVEVNDRPLGVSGSQLFLSLGIDSTTTIFAQHLDSAIQLALTTLKGNATSDANALFRRIRQEIDPDSLAEFDANATTANLEELVGMTWPSKTALSEALTTLLTDAAELIPGPKTFQGTLSIQGDNSILELFTAAEVSAEDAGFVTNSVWSVSAESTTTLVLGGVLEYRTVGWLAAIAKASTISPPVPTLQNTADCAALGIAWTEANGADIYQECDAECSTSLCDQAIETLWADVEETGELVKLHVGITGEAETQGPAEVSGFSGTWIGRFNDGETSLKGPALGAPPP